MSTIGRIVKDGLQAFVVWLIIFFVLTFFFGVFGRVLGLFIGLIFAVSFFALRLSEILAFVLGRGRRQQPASYNTPPPVALPGAARAAAAPAAVEPTYCPKCGSAWVPGARACANCG
jgi:ABC-type multidrug transport system permease subunit